MARGAAVALGAAAYYGWLVFGTQLMDRQAVRMCLDYGVCGDVQLYGALMVVPLVLGAVWVASRVARI